MFSKFQYISQGLTIEEQQKNIQEALDSGCTWVQLRFKNTTGSLLHNVAHQIKKLCESYKATFIVNDHPLTAYMVSADGVHLGVNDMPVEKARLIIGNTKFIGGTANTFQQVKQRIMEGCDYIGLGPYRYTTTKENLSPVLGYEGLKKITDELQHQKITIPIYAIGGIRVQDIASIMRCNVYGIAASGLLTHHTDKKKLITQLNTLLYGSINDCR